MLKFNTFRARRYLRSRFVEGRFLLASEATDLELELQDFARELVRQTVGDVAIADGWKVERLNATQLLVKPGDAWFDGLPFQMRGGKDQLVSGSNLALGTVVLIAGSTGSISVADDATGLGKILTFNGSIISGDYDVIVTAREEVIDATDDAFIQSANLAETTGQKLRLNFRLNVVPTADQTETPIPYTNDATDGNLVNQIVVTPTAGGNGELITLTAVPGSERIDGRDVELTIRNDVSLGGGNPIPNGTTDQGDFFNGKFIDSVGTEYHMNAVFNDTIASRVIIRLDKEVGQPDPIIIADASTTYTLRKRDQYVTDDANGNPLGKRFYSLSTVSYNQSDGFVHDSKIVDLRKPIDDEDLDKEEDTQKFNTKLTDGGIISAEPADAASGNFTITDYTMLGGDTFTVNTVAFVEGVDFNAVTSNNQTAANLRDAINNSIDPLVDNFVQAEVNTNVVTITALATGTAGNALAIVYTDSGSGVGATVSGPTLSGGTDPITGQLTWDDAFRILTGNTPAMDISSNNVILQDEGMLAYELDYAAGGAVEVGNQAVTTTTTGNTILMSGSPNLSLVRVGNTIAIDATGESASIVSIDDTNDSFTVSGAGLSTDGPATIYRDTFADGTLPTDSRIFVLAVRQGSTYHISDALIIAAGGTSEGDTGGSGSGGASGDLSDILTYIGSPSQTDDSPSYISTVFINNGDSLTLGIGKLDAALNANATRDNQDRNVKMIGGGTFFWDGNDLSWSADAFMNFPGFTDDRNEISAGMVTLAANEVAYVDLNRTVDSPTVLTVAKATIAALTLNDNRIIFARRDGADVLVGTHSFRLTTGERLELDGALQEIERLLGQLKLERTANTNEVSIAGSDTALLDGETLSQELSDFLLDFSGATIDFTAGTATVNITGLAAIGTEIPNVGEFKWFGIGLLGDVVGADNRISAQIQVTPAASPDPVQGDADFPLISGTKKLGAVLVQNVAGAAQITQINRLGVGSGGGGGGLGDITGIETRLLDMLMNSLYEFLTPNVFAADESDKADGSSTGAFSSASSTFELNSGETFVSIQMLDNDFLNEGNDINTVQLSAFWDLTALDLAATYEVSRSAGLEYQTVTMEQIGESDHFVGTHEFTEEATNNTVASQAVTNTTEELNDTTQQAIAQEFALIRTTAIRELDLDLTVNGSPTGKMIVRLVNDSAGLPSTSSTDILTETSVDVSTLVTGTNTISIPRTVLVPDTYHITMTGDSDYQAAFVTVTTSVEIDANSAGSDASVFNGTIWSGAGSNLTFDLKGYVLDLRIRITASGSPDPANLTGTGILYDLTTTGVIGGFKNRQVFSFNSTSNPNEFDVTAFTPDPDLFRMILVETGQMFMAPALTFDGKTVIFPEDSFDNGGIPADFNLIAFQPEGGSFDNSDLNALLMAGNFLGSTDPSVDRSSPGRGILLRSPNGSLYEITIKDGGTGFDIFLVT